MKPAPPVTSTFMAKPISSTLHPATYTVLLRRVSTMLPCLARYLRVGDVAHGREGEITEVGRIAYDGVQKIGGVFRFYLSLPKLRSRLRPGMHRQFRKNPLGVVPGGVGADPELLRDSGIRFSA